jgi:hypothetical protein
VLLDDMVTRLDRTGAAIVLFTGIDTNFTPVFRPFRGKVAIYNENVRAIAERHDCIVADQWGLKIIQDPRFFADDRLHMNPLGHHEVARMVLRALNVPNDLQEMVADPFPARTWRRPAARTWSGRARTWCRGCCDACATSRPATASRPSAPSRCPWCCRTTRDRVGGTANGRSAAWRMLQRPERDGRGRGDVERVHATGHGDGHHGVRGRQRLGGQAGPLGSERECDAFGRRAA